MPVHTVAQGECISSIADKEGFFWETIWNQDQNKDLRELRQQNPNALMPGDSLFIPDKRKKEESCACTMRHKFKLLGVPVRFKLQILDESGNPRKGIPYKLVIDGKTTQGVIPADGNLSEIIKPNARKATLTLSPPGRDQEQYNFQLGFMNPSDEITGCQGRLQNLGYYKGDITGSLDDDTAEAIRQFQQDAGLDITGEADEATQAALGQRHGG